MRSAKAYSGGIGNSGIDFVGLHNRNSGNQALVDSFFDVAEMREKKLAARVLISELKVEVLTGLF